MINPHALKSALNQIQTIIDTKFPQFNIIHRDPLYYFTFGDFLYTRVHSTLYLRISPFKQPLLLYHVYSFPVQVNSSTPHATQLKIIPHSRLSTFHSCHTTPTVQMLWHFCQILLFSSSTVYNSFTNLHVSSFL